MLWAKNAVQPSCPQHFSQYKRREDVVLALRRRARERHSGARSTTRRTKGIENERQTLENLHSVGFRVGLKELKCVLVQSGSVDDQFITVPMHFNSSSIFEYTRVFDDDATYKMEVVHCSSLPLSLSLSQQLTREENRSLMSEMEHLKQHALLKQSKGK